MAPKRPSRLLEDPPSASPSQEHEEEEDLEESLDEKSVEEESEEEENEIVQKTPQISKLSQTSQNHPRDGSSDEELEGSETDNSNTKHSPTASSYIIKPTVNKENHSMEPKKPAAKRALVNNKERKDTPKRTKVAKDHSQEDRVETPKKAGSVGGRVWNADDVISILGGMIDYQKQKGVDPQADIGAFLEFVKGRFGFEVTRTQLYEKIRSLKKKFVANQGKGESFIPTKPHDIDCFELSKKIWGSKNVADGVGNIGSNLNDGVVANGVDHTEHVKIVDGELVKKKSSKGKSSEGKRREKGEKRKKGEKKNKKMDNGPNIAEKEAEPVIDEDVMNDKEHVVMDDENVVEKKVEPTDDEGVVKDNEDVVKKYEIVVQKEAEPVTDEDVPKDKEDVVMDDENRVNGDGNISEDSVQNISVKYPKLVASLSFNMPENQRKLMMEGICLVGSEKARELDDLWRELEVKEAEFFSRKMELMAKLSKLVVHAMKNR